MKPLILSLLAVTLSSSALASSGAGNYVSYTHTFDKQGLLIFSGPSAQALWNDMTGARYRPAAPDLEQKDPAEMALSDCAAKIGEQVTCFQRPRLQGDKLVRDADGKVIYDAACVVDIADVTTGKF